MQRMVRLLATVLGVTHALTVEKDVASSGVPTAMMLPPRGGVFCRGNGCPYSEVGVVGGQNIMGHTQTEEGVEQQAKAALAIGMDALLARKEFCRGMSCVDGMGKPLDRTKAAFAAQCSHFFAGGLEGHDEYRTVKQVYDSFGSICGPRVGNAEMPLCRAYGDVFAAALAPQMDAITVGSADAICNIMFDFLQELKQAQVDLQLFEGSMDHPDAAGPESERGRRWSKFVEMSTPKPLNETHGNLLAGLQVGKDQEVNKYEITMPSWDGALKATTVPGALFDHCEAEMKEIMLDAPQTSGRVAKMAVDWCNFQQLRGGGRSDWSERTCIGIGKLFGLALRNIPDPPPLDQPPMVLAGALPKPTFGQLSPTMPPTYTMMPTIPDPPKWGEPPTSGPVPPKMSKEQMQRMLDPARFLLRPDQVCQQLFVAIGAATRTEGLLRNSFKTSFRVPSAGMSLPPKDDFMLQAMQQAADFRKAATEQKEAEVAKAEAGLKEAAADLAKPATQTQPEPPAVGLGSLPHSSDYNPKVTIGASFLRMHR